MIVQNAFFWTDHLADLPDNFNAVNLSVLYCCVVLEEDRSIIW